MTNLFMKRMLTALVIFSLLILSADNVLAVKPVKTAPVETSEKEVKKLKKFEKKISKRMAKMEAKANKADVDFDDPVDKWMWFWIFGWGAGLTLTFLALVTSFGFLGFLASACYLFGFVALVLWVVKKFS